MASAAEEPNGLYVAGFWGPRGEDLDTAARRLKRFLDRLKAIHPFLAEWYFGVTYEGAPRVPIPSSETGLRELIANRGAPEGPPTDNPTQLDAIVGAWAGDYSVSGSFTVRLGWTSERVGNAAVLNLPGELDPEFTDPARTQSLIDAIVSAWDPDRAVLRPHDVLRKDAPEAKPAEIVRVETRWKRFPDWIVYKRGLPLEFGGPFEENAR
jgi:hypothetical protein